MSDAIANALRIAERQTERNPSDAQKEAGNYAKGKMDWNGVRLAIENPKGGERSGTDANGKRWSVKLPAAYGYALGSEGADGDHVDVYVGPDHGSRKVYVVDQVDAKTGKYDEHKCLLSFASKADALAAYEKAFSDGKAKDRIGAVTELSVDAFRDWIKNGDTKKPLGDIRKGYATGGRVENMAYDRDVLAHALRIAQRAAGGRVGYRYGGGPDWRSDMDAPAPMDFTGPQQEVLTEHTPGWGDRLEAVLRQIASPVMGARKAQQMSDDFRSVRRPTESFVASAADPLAIPSSALGVVSPELRDEWRSVQNQEGLAPKIAGSLLGGTAAFKGAMLGAKGLVDQGVRSGGASTISDFLDRAAGKEDAIGSHTAGKALLGQIGIAPGRVANAAVAGVGSGLLAQSGLPSYMGAAKAADAAPLSTEEAARRKELQGKKSLKTREQEELKALNERSAAAAASELKARQDADREGAAAKREADRIASERAAAADVEARSLSRAQEREAGDRAVAAYDKSKASHTVAQTPFEETLWGRNVNPAIMPLIIGALSGAALGGKGAAGARTASGKWQSALDDAGTATVPSARQDALSRADAMSKVFPEGASPLKGYPLPMTLGAVEGVGGTYLSNAWDKNLPEKNPERAAIEAALATLPPGHKDRVLYESRLNDPKAPGYAQERNPARERAEQKPWTDLAREAAERGALGVTGGALGKTLGSLPGPSAERIAELRALTGRASVDPKLVADEGKRMLSVEKADSAYRGASQEIAELERVAAEARRRSNGPTGDLDQVLSGTKSRPQPRLESSGNPSSSSPVSSGTGTIPQIAAPGERQTIDFGDKSQGLIQDLIKAVGARAETPPVAAVPGAAAKTLPDPGTGKWAREIAPTARDVIRKRADEGKSIAEGTGAQIYRDVSAALPPGVKTSAADVRERAKNMREQLGTDTPTRSQFDELFDRAQGSISNGRKVFAVPAAIGASGATGYGLSSDTATAAPLPPPVKREKHAVFGHTLFRNRENGQFASKPEKPTAKTDDNTEAKARGGAVSAALDVARRYAHGGAVHVGALTGSTPGRADAVKTAVGDGSYIWSADVVAGRGQGNSAAGQKYIARLEDMAREKMGRRYGGRSHASGGSVGGSSVPVLLSDGERCTAPEVVAALGDGDMKRGHAVCDALAKQWREEDIKRLNSLPPPSK